MVIKARVLGGAAVAISLFGLGQVPATHPVSRADPPVQADALPAKVTDELDVFRRAAADAAAGHPVTYGDGQCYPLVEQYIQALGYPWVNRDLSDNAFDLYEHFPTNGLGQFFERIPFAGGANEPHVGDIVVYGPGGFVSQHGHVAVVTAVRDSGSLFSYETADQNSSGQLFVTLNSRDFNPGYNTLGYLRPKV